MDKGQFVKRYEPILLFSHSDKGPENFYPLALEHFVAESRLYRFGQEQALDLAGGLSLSSLGKVPARESQYYYLSYVADSLVDQSPGVAALFKGRGLSRFAVSENNEDDERPDHNVSPEGKAIKLPESSDDDDWEEDDWEEEGPSSYGLVEGLTETQQLPPEITQKAIETYRPYQDFSQYPPVYYYRVMRNRGYTVIQYWFFYAFNDWGTSHAGMNDHEGDWELVSLFFEDMEKAPTYAAYAAHIAGLKKYRWADIETYKDTHPLVYVGCGSHASYPHAGVYKTARVLKDYAEASSAVKIGLGQNIAWGAAIDLEKQAWNHNFAGHWGSVFRRFGTSNISQGIQGPKGPAWQFDSWERPVKAAKL